MRENIGYVGQEPVLFATSIKQNLMMAKEDATDAELWDALKKANAAEFVQGLPDKMNTFVGNSGTALSGGQKQRLAIARAILKNPQILLLDEATSALDRKNEMEIQKTLDEISHGRTTIVIAHRLSTVMNADHIIVFDQGKIVEEGRHEELIAKKGRYYVLQQFQLQTQDNDKDEAKPQEETLKEPVLTSKVSSIKNKVNAKETPAEIEIAVVDPRDQIPVKNKKKSSSVFARLFVYSKGDLPIIIIGCISSLIHGTLMPLIAPILANMVTVLSFPEDPDYGKKTGLYSGYFLAIAVVGFITLSIQLTLFNMVAEQLSRKVRGDVFRKYIRMPISWFDEPHNSPAALGSKLSTDASLINTLTGSAFGPSLQALSSLVPGLVISHIAN